jgi:hypothetical protein
VNPEQGKKAYVKFIWGGARNKAMCYHVYNNQSLHKNPSLHACFIWSRRRQNPNIITINQAPTQHIFRGILSLHLNSYTTAISVYTVFWDSTLCNLVNHYQCFTGTKHLSNFSIKEYAEYWKLAHIYRDGRQRLGF